MDASAETVKQHINSCLKNIQKPRVKRTTYQLQKGIVDNWIMPEIGIVRLQRLKPDHIDAVLIRLREEGRSGSYQQRTYHVMN